MSLRLRLILALSVLAGPVAAEPADCPTIAAALTGLTGYAVVAPAARPVGEACVFDRAVLKAEGAPDLTVERLQLTGETAEGALVFLALEAGGVRVAAGLGQRDMDPVLRETLRLQTAEVVFQARVAPDGLALRDGRLRLSGGTELKVEADLAGAGLSSRSLMVGRLTWARLDWNNDGRLLRPLLRAWGENLVDGAGGAAALDASRLALRHVVANLPASFLPEEGQATLDKVIDALPQGRGRLLAEFNAPEGIGAAEVGIAVLSGDPLGPEALGRLFAGAKISLDWQPGLSP